MESVGVVPVSLFEPPKVSCQGPVLQCGETAKEQESLAVKKMEVGKVHHLLDILGKFS